MRQPGRAFWVATIAFVLLSVAARAQVPGPASLTEDGRPRQAVDAQGTAAAQPPQAAASASTPIRLGVLSYISFQAGDLPDSDSRFLVKRTYINVEADVLPYMSVRVTPDARLSDDGFELRLKYAYAQFKSGGNRFVTAPTLQAGIVPTPWFPFEERVNRYRMQDPMFIERVGILNSADVGVTVSGLFGGTLSEDVRRATGDHQPGRWGSFALGVYNGGGYAAREENSNKVFHARLTARPLPDSVPGLQVSYLLIRGAGNTEVAPDWRDNLITVSWEHPRVAASVQWLDGRGNQSGSCADPDSANAWPHRGWSVFGEGRLGPRWSVIARLDDFQTDTRVPGSRYRRAISGVAYHLGRGNSLLADIDHRNWLDPARPDETRYQVTLQISF